MTKQVRAEIYGRVQAVGFRAFTYREATRLGVSGWVRNRPDGSVELVAQGEEHLVNQLLQRVSEGPSYARVEEVKTRWGDPQPDLEGFSLRW